MERTISAASAATAKPNRRSCHVPPAPSAVDWPPEAARPALNETRRKLGTVPNLFRVIANSPAALAGYLGLSGALAGGVLDAATRERIALAVAEFNGCGYCLSAHTYLARNVAKLDAAEVAANRDGTSGDPRTGGRRLPPRWWNIAAMSTTWRSPPCAPPASRMRRSSRSCSTWR